MTKTTRLIIITLGLAIVLPASLSAEIKPPTLRVTSEWLVISSYHDHGDSVLPLTVALRKNSIKSINIWTDRSKLSSEDLKDITPEKIENLPATIYIVTDERDTSGANKTYQVAGLTNATAPAMLEKLLNAAGDPTATTPVK